MICIIDIDTGDCEIHGDECPLGTLVAGAETAGFTIQLRPPSDLDDMGLEIEALAALAEYFHRAAQMAETARWN